MCKAALLGKVERQWKYLGVLTEFNIRKITVFCCYHHCYFCMPLPPLFLLSRYLPLSSSHSSSHIPNWCPWISPGIFFALFLYVACPSLTYIYSWLSPLLGFSLFSLSPGGLPSYICPCHAYAYSLPCCWLNCSSEYLSQSDKLCNILTFIHTVFSPSRM